MTVRQKIKIILQILAINTLFLLNTAFYQKYNYFSPAKHLAYIPVNTVFAATFNTKVMATKAFRTFLFKNEQIMSILNELEPDEKNTGKLFESGIDLTNQASFFIYREPNKEKSEFACVLADVASKSNVIDQLNNSGYVSVGKSKNIFSKDAKNYAFVNDEIVGYVLFRDSKLKIKDAEKNLALVFKKKDNNKIAKHLTNRLQLKDEFVFSGQTFETGSSPLFVKEYTCHGKLVNDALEFSAELIFANDASNYFPEHKINNSFDFTSLDGYTYLKTSFKTPNAIDVFQKFKLINFNDSITKMLEPALENQYGNGLELYCYNLKKAELILSDKAPTDLKILSKNFLLPGFDFRLHCSAPAKIDTVFMTFSRAGKLSKQENNWYLWQHDKHYALYFGIKNDWLNITTEKEHPMQIPNTGYSNVFYFNSDKLSEKIPIFGSQMMAEQFRIFEYVLAYSTALKEDKLSIKGKMVFTTGEDALIELLRVMMRYRDKDIKGLLSLVS